MSMMMTLRRLTDADLAVLEREPDVAVPMLRDVDGLEAIGEGLTQRNMQAAIAAVGADVWRQYADGATWAEPFIANAMVEFLREHAPPDVSRPEYLDLDKSWHILHTVISGSPEPGDGAAASLLGGAPVGPEGGYGPARLLRREEVDGFAAVLAGLDAAALIDRADPAALQAAGVTFATSDFDRDMVTVEIEDHFPALQKFVAQTSKKKRHLLTFLE